MKKLFLFLCLTCSVLTFVYARVEYRYWFDNDITEYQSIFDEENLSISIDAKDLKDGVHTLNVMAIDDNGRISSAKTRFFIKTHSFGHTLRYWFDNDSESGGILQGETIAANIDVSHLSEGIHKIYFQTADDSPSVVKSTYFIKLPQIEGGRDMRGFIYIDGTQLTHEDVTATGSVITFDFDVTSLDEGIHQLMVQLLTPDGAVATTRTSWFVRVATSDELGEARCMYTLDNSISESQKGTYIDGCFHFDFDVSALSDGLHKVSCQLLTKSGSVSSIHDSYFIKTPLGGNSITTYEYWINDNYDSRVQKHFEYQTTNFNLTELLPVEPQSLRSCSFTFELKNDVPVIYARNDFHFRVFDKINRLTDCAASYTDYNVSRIIDNAETLESGKPQTKRKPQENEIQWYKFYAQTGDSLAFKVDKACALQIFNPSGDEVYHATGIKSTRWGGCHALKDGTYYLALHDVAAKQATTTRLEYQHIDKYAVLDYTPDISGTYVGYLHMSLLGNGFDKLNRAELVKDGFTIKTDTLVAHGKANAIMEFFLLGENMPKGNYDLKLFFGEGEQAESLIIANAIKFEESKYGNIQVDVKSNITTVKPYPVSISVKNTGNVEYQMVPLIIGHDHPGQITATNFVNFSIYGDSSDDVGNTPVSFNTDNLLGKCVKGVIYPTLIPMLHPNEEIVLQLSFDCQNSPFNIYSWVYRPWGLIGSEATGRVNSRNHSSKAPVVDNFTCDFDPCELIPTNQCVCGIVWENIAVIGNTYAATQNVVHNAYNEHMRRYGFEPEFTIIRLKSPWSSLRSAITKCGGEWADDELNLLAERLMNAMEDVGADDCPDPREHTAHPISSFDPNEISGYISEAGSKYIGKEVKQIFYNIEFENDSTLASAAAHHIVLRDTLDTKLFDMESFSPTRISLGKYQLMLDKGQQSFIKTVDLRPVTDALAQIELKFDVGTGIMELDLQSLDPYTLNITDDVTSGLLAIGASGQFSFEINLKDGLSDGTEIPNTADIVFDAADPIVTPTWVNITDYVSPVSNIKSMNIVNNMHLQISLYGEDNLSGIWKYDLYVQHGKNQEWILLESNITETEIYVDVVDDIDYGFCVIATDKAGNREIKDFNREYSFLNGQISTEIPIIESHDINGTTIYDLSGRRVFDNPTPGIYIQNGHKVFIR